MRVMNKKNTIMGSYNSILNTSIEYIYESIYDCNCCNKERPKERRVSKESNDYITETMISLDDS